MRGLKRAKRVRFQLAEPHPGIDLPSIEGLLVATRRREYVIALPQLLVAAGAQPVELESQLLVIPRERVAWYEVIR